MKIFSRNERPLVRPRDVMRVSWILVLVAFVAAGQSRPAGTLSPVSGQAILEELRAFNTFGSLLHVAAHPDDENTQLITFGAKGRHYRTAYLSVTRGDGGQNVIGPELDEALGLIRTQELLAARRLDGGRQFFTRAIDFGYSKSPDETLQIWNRKEVLGDVVRVIRTFRPDVIVTRFSPEPSGTHGHHTASAILALEAFRLAGDPTAYPEQLESLEPWQPVRILLNRGRWGSNAAEQSEGVLRVRVDGIDPVSGASFAAIAGRSRALHKSQGFGEFGGSGDGERYESFVLLDGKPALEDVFDDIDTTWGRIPDGAAIGSMTARVIETFDAEQPAAKVPALLDIRSRLTALLARHPSDPLLAEKLSDLDRIIFHCIGLSLETTADRAEAVPGETLELRHTVSIVSEAPEVRWMTESDGTLLVPGRTETAEEAIEIPGDAPMSQPYWLRDAPATGIYSVKARELIGLPENPPAVESRLHFQIGGQDFEVPTAPVWWDEQPSGERSATPLNVIAPISLTFRSEVLLFAPGSTRDVRVVATASRSSVKGVVRLEVPQGWEVAPRSLPVAFSDADEAGAVTFRVTAPGTGERAAITASVEVDGRLYTTGYSPIRYAHIPAQVLQPEARVTALSLELETRGRQVGYVPGAGDRIPEALAEMGVEVVTLPADDISDRSLSGLDAVVVGIRAFETEDALRSRVPLLFDYVAAGGTVVAQYNREDGLESAPLPLQISRDRVTREDAPVTMLAPEHPALNTPNRITPADFAGWVQERSIYVPVEWDSAYVPLLAAGDPGEPQLRGQLLVARHGTGYFVYTGLVFFRQLPAGVPGAYRLFANLVSLGKS